jgi:hypothetical protein
VKTHNNGQRTEDQQWLKDNDRALNFTCLHNYNELPGVCCNSFFVPTVLLAFIVLAQGMCTLALLHTLRQMWAF